MSLDVDAGVGGEGMGQKMAGGVDIWDAVRSRGKDNGEGGELQGL